MAESDYEMEFYAKDLTAGALPGMTPERVEWTQRRAQQLFSTGSTLEEVRTTIKEEAQAEPWNTAKEKQAV